jgi:large subunit ribosomal protein L25
MSESTDIVITVEQRADLGKEAAGRLRREGNVPAVVYGGDRPPVPITVEEERVRELLKQEAGGNTIFLLKMKGTAEERRAMIKEIQVDPLSGKFQHIDFIRVTRGHKLHVSMPVELVGDSAGVRHGGRIDFVTRELAVEILPREMFDKITVDIADLEVGEHINVGDLEDKLPPSARFEEDPSRVVVVIEVPRVLEEEVEEEEEAEEEMVISETAEPELIRKGKEDEEGEQPEKPSKGRE